MFKFIKENETENANKVWKDVGSAPKPGKDEGSNPKPRNNEGSEQKRRDVDGDQQNLKEISLKLDQLEKALEQSLLRSPEYHIHIENLTLQNPVLESLAFRLDKLDIKDLSGALNLGNNFGASPPPKLDQKKKPSNSHQETNVKTKETKPTHSLKKKSYDQSSNSHSGGEKSSVKQPDVNEELKLSSEQPQAMTDNPGLPDTEAPVIDDIPTGSSLLQAVPNYNDTIKQRRPHLRLNFV